MNSGFQVKLTADFQDNGKLVYQDIGLDLLDGSDGIAYAFLDRHQPEVESDQLHDTDAVIVLSPRITKASLEDLDRLTMISRFGVGYDSVDVDACTEADVVLTITAGGVDYSVAEAVITMMLAISHNLVIKDRITREGRWDERSGHMGSELRDRTLGIIGLGGIGGTLANMIGGFRMAKPIAYDPHIPAERAKQLGVTLVDRDDLLRASDFVSVNCPLNDDTRDLIGDRELSLMKPTAYLINTARGGIVNETALIDALREKRIAGAALDCHENEPMPPGHPISLLENVILAPHAIAWTNELFRDLGRKACSQVIDLSTGQIPDGVVNRAVLDRPGFKAKLARYSTT